MKKRFVAIHGHFYQPPRENAWLEQIEIQESAAPYHDWNERIASECYGPNGVSRILNDNKQIVDIVNNYARMSFNFGPTLLSWLQAKMPKIYHSIIEADKLSLEIYKGHGSAIAQVYNHIIMPLATSEDKLVQVHWGIYDFEKRFGRRPEGMWLAETAVDIETLEILADHGIKFTVLAPNQAKGHRKIDEKNWHPGADPRRPYKCNLPNGKSITLFFYEGDKSQGVAFKGLLNDGRFFAEQLLNGFDPNHDEPQLMHIATDGESYGHHHRNGDMALAYCMRHIENSGLAELTNYSRYLSLVEVTYEAQIHENSSWSCIHGVERWKSNCGCETGGRPGWNQEWRVGLREAINELRDKLHSLYLTEMIHFHKKPNELFYNYIQLVFDRSSENFNVFFNTYFEQKLNGSEVSRIIRLLEMKRHSMLMQTSCGWFFTEVSGIETVQILQYANRAMQLAETEFGINYEPDFIRTLSTAKSNIEEHGDAGKIYKKWVQPKRLTLTHVGMHYAVNSLFEESNKHVSILNFDCESLRYSRKKAGTLILVTGETSVKSQITHSEKTFHYAIIYLGNHHLIGSTSTSLSQIEFESIVEQIEKSFERGHVAECIDIIKWNFLDRSFSFFNLFRDEQIKLLELVTREYEKNALNSYQRIYDNSYSLLNFMNAEKLQLPSVLQRNMETVFQFKLEYLFSKSVHDFSLERLQRYSTEIKKWHANIDHERTAYFASRFIQKQIEAFDIKSDSVEWMQTMYKILTHVHDINLNVGLNELQDFIFRLAKENHLAPNLHSAVRQLAEYINLHFEVAETN